MKRSRYYKATPTSTSIISPNTRPGPHPPPHSSPRTCSLQLIHIQWHVVRTVQRRRRPPHLQHVVLRRGRDRPVLVRAPREVGRTRGVPPVDKEELGRAVLGVVRALLLANL